MSMSSCNGVPGANWAQLICAQTSSLASKSPNLVPYHRPLYWPLVTHILIHLLHVSKQCTALPFLEYLGYYADWESVH